MLTYTNAYSGFAVDDLKKARAFYGDTLGIDVSGEGDEVLTLNLPGRPTLVYAKPDLKPGNYTILNFEVEDIDVAVEELTSRGVEFERYEGFEQDEKGVFRGRAAGQGPDIAWFEDPAGNILSVMQG